MPQFDVYVNPQTASRPTVPYVLDLQNALIDQLPSRLVMPISRLGVGLVKLPKNLCLEVEVSGEMLTLMPHLSAPVASRLLKQPVASLAYRSHEVMAALDAVTAGF
jgi:toxin CcdB